MGRLIKPGTIQAVMQSHSVVTTHKGGLAFSSAIGNHTLLMDASQEHGGQDLGASPKRLMLASLAGCTGIDVVMLLDKMKASFSDFSIDVEAELSADHPKIYTHVTLVYRIRMKETERPKMEKAVQMSQEKYCGVSAMFKAFASLDHEIIYL